MIILYKQSTKQSPMLTKCKLLQKWFRAKRRCALFYKYCARTYRRRRKCKWRISCGIQGLAKKAWRKKFIRNNNSFHRKNSSNSRRKRNLHGKFQALRKKNKRLRKRNRLFCSAKHRAGFFYFRIKGKTRTLHLF